MSSGWALITRARRGGTRSSVLPLDRDAERQLLQPAEVEAAVPFGFGGRHDRREATDQGADRILRFESRQGSAEAVVGATTEGQVLLGVGPRDIESIGRGTPMR